MRVGSVLCIVSMLSFHPFLSVAQSGEEGHAEAQMESIAGREEDGPGNMDVEMLAVHRQRMMRVNVMGRAQLIEDLDLTNEQTDAMLNYRSRFGAFMDPMELQAVPGWSLDLVRRILPLIRLDTTVRLVPTVQERLVGSGQHLVLRLGSVMERARGYLPDSNGRRTYAGSSLRSMLFYRVRFRSSLDVGIRIEKDAGESWLTSRHFPDRVSAFLSLRDLGPVHALTVGDFEVSMGQGLLIWQSMAFRKGANTMDVMRSGTLFKPHSGGDENRYMRGVAIGFQKRSWTVDVFSGSTKRDAHPVFDSAVQIAYFSGMQTSGLHRTVSEIIGRRALTDFSYGGRAAFATHGYSVGVNLIAHRFSHVFESTPEPYARFGALGDHLLNASIDHHLRAGAIHIYGEWALDKERHFAVTEGLLCSPGPRLDLVLQMRSFSRAYTSLHESPFAEGSKAQNEAGVYLGIDWHPATTFRLTAYVDRYRFSWLRYGVNGPSEGSDALVRLSWRPDRNTECYGQMVWERRPADPPDLDPFLPGPVGVRRFRLRMHVQHTPDRSISLRIRAEYSFLGGKSDEKGFLGFADMIWKAKSQLTRIMFRLLLVHTDGYGSRIYAYESALPGMYSIPPHYGEGLQWSFQGLQRLTGRLEIGVGVRQNVSHSSDNQGSGYETISGGHKTEWNLLIRSSF